MFQVDAVFIHGHIARQVILVHAAKGAQKISVPRPQPFGAVDMHFTDTVAIIIPRPFVLAMIDGHVQALNLIVARPLIGIRHPIRPREAAMWRFKVRLGAVN